MDDRYSPLLSDFAREERARIAQALAALVTEMADTGKTREDPIRELPARIGDRWSTLLLLLLRIAPFRHGALKRMVAEVSAEGRISQRMLTLRLRSLERDGLVTRSVTGTAPQRVEYAITPLGLGLLAQVDALLGWLAENDQAIRAARARFDVAEAAEAV